MVGDEQCGTLWPFAFHFQPDANDPADKAVIVVRQMLCGRWGKPQQKLLNGDQRQGQCYKPQTTEIGPDRQHHSEQRQTQNIRINGRAFLPFIVGPAATRLLEAQLPIERLCRMIVGGDFEKQ